MTTAGKVTIGIGAAAILLIAFWLAKPADTGVSRFYADQPYHFQTLRAFSDIPFGAGDAGEILATIKHIPEGDDEAWFREWEKTAERLEKAARGFKNPVSRGCGLLRAHGYYRTAEFFMNPSDPRRLPVFRKGLKAFYDGLKSLGIPHHIIK